MRWHPIYTWRRCLGLVHHAVLSFEPASDATIERITRDVLGALLLHAHLWVTDAMARLTSHHLRQWWNLDQCIMLYIAHHRLTMHRSALMDAWLEQEHFGKGWDNFAPKDLLHILFFVVKEAYRRHTTHHSLTLADDLVADRRHMRLHHLLMLWAGHQAVTMDVRIHCDIRWLSLQAQLLHRVVRRLIHVMLLLFSNCITGYTVFFVVELRLRV